MVAQHGIEETGKGATTPSHKNSKTTSGRFSHSIKGLVKSKPKGGAPLGNRNALKTGRFTAERRAWRKEVHKILSDGRALLRNLKDSQGAKA